MSQRTQQEVNDIGFKALVQTLGREDALRFIHGVSGARLSSPDMAEENDAATPLPPLTPDEIHEKIMQMREPDQQASFL